MNNGAQRFNFFLDQFEGLLLKAGKQKNPALYLYRQNARTPLFMLEGLAKLYCEIHNHKKFSKIKEHFKLLEDALGAIDYYDAIAKNLSKNKKIPAKVMLYLQAQTREKIQHLNEILVEKKWTASDNAKILKIRKKLKEADWLAAEKELAGMEDFYKKSIGSIIDFTKGTAYHFDNMEQDVHELRRKLRWLSIYPQALQGCIQLSDTGSKATYLTKYLTKEIVNSPYNKMPDSGDNNQFLLLSKKHFLALSWIIDALGKLKDSGLQLTAIQEAFEQSENMDEAEALKKAYQVLGTRQTKLPLLLQEAASISKVYFKEQNLEQLLIGTATSA